MRLVEHFEATANRTPERAFLDFVEVDDLLHQSLTYAEAEQEANRRANLLIDLGIEKGQCIGILQNNSTDWVLWYLAALKTGLVAVALNPDAPQSELENLAVDADIRVLLSDDLRARLAQAVAERTSNVRAALSPSGNEGTLPARVRIAGQCSKKPHLAAAQDGSDCVAIIFSSGTTGARPKAVMLTDRQLVCGIGAYGTAAGIGHSDRIFLCTPIFHSCTLAWGITLAILAGATIVLADRFSASKNWEAIQDSDATVFWTMGSILHILMQSPGSDVEDQAASQLRVIFAAGLGRQVAVARERWRQPKLIDGYGLTESPGTMAFEDSFDRNEDFPCIGRPVSSVTMTIVDRETGQHCGPRETGEIVIDLDSGFAGYLNNPAANAEAIRNGVFHTGDLAYTDEEGRFYFVSRIKDIIRRGGQNISAGEVEQAVLQHPDIAEAAVVPKPDDVLGEKVALYCVLKEGSAPLTLADLRTFCEGKLARYRFPEHIELKSARDIPRLASGKIAKFQLKMELLEQR